jgi:putative endonuclease
MAWLRESPRKPRQQAVRAGRRAELIATALLRLKGYRILARDYRAGVRELDIVARRGRLLAVVEVKRRHHLLSALECGDRSPATAHCPGDGGFRGPACGHG